MSLLSLELCLSNEQHSSKRYFISWCCDDGGRVCCFRISHNCSATLRSGACEGHDVALTHQNQTIQLPIEGALPALLHVTINVSQTCLAISRRRLDRSITVHVWNGTFLCLYLSHFNFFVKSDLLHWTTLTMSGCICNSMHPNHT